MTPIDRPDFDDPQEVLKTNNPVEESIDRE
jgi:hypothetical protein